MVLPRGFSGLMHRTFDFGSFHEGMSIASINEDSINMKKHALDAKDRLRGTSLHILWDNE